MCYFIHVYYSYNFSLFSCNGTDVSVHIVKNMLLPVSCLLLLCIIKLAFQCLCADISKQNTALFMFVQNLFVLFFASYAMDLQSNKSIKSDYYLCSLACTYCLTRLLLSASGPVYKFKNARGHGGFLHLDNNNGWVCHS